MLRRTKKDLYLHIGLGKTGTTSLQTFFWANRNLLGKLGILYPKYGVVAGAHHVLSPHVPPFLANVWKFIPVEEWAPEIYRQADRPVLLSSELISSLKPELVRGVAAVLQRYFNPKVIIYLRRQDHVMIAAYNQQVKAGTQVLDIRSALGMLYKRFDYEDRIKPWMDAFGRDNLILRPYERRQLRDGDIRSDFLAGVLGIEDASKFETSDTNENPRFAYSALEYKRAINNVVKDTQASTRFNEALLAYSADVDQGSTAIFHESDLLAGAERKMILNRARHLNRWIAKDVMGRADGILFKDPEPEDDPNWIEPSVGEDDFVKIGQIMKSKNFARELMGHIDQSLRTDLFEGYRYARKLAQSIGEKI